MEKQDLINKLEPYGQEHLVKFFDELNYAHKVQLIDDIQCTDFAELEKYFELVKNEMNQSAEELDEAMQPIPSQLKGSYVKSSSEQLNYYEQIGLKAIANGEVAVLLLAGGQGTRLGVSYPKGMYSVGLPSKKTLYQLQAERLIRLQELAEKQFQTSVDKSVIPWYIMTSEHTQESTIEFFRQNSYFGLNKENIKFFEQFMLPCLTKEGKVILDEKHKISKAPDGNGGLYKALLKRHIIEDMKKRNIKYVHIYCVDNILVRIADPIFVGFCIGKNANCGAKVVKKIDPEEKVGVICKVNDRFQVVEYSEISQKTRNLRDADNELTYNAGNICNHFLTTEFLNEICSKYENELRHHVAEKKIPYIDENGIRICPKSNNGIKLERFIFDVFPYSTNFAIWEVPREEDFSPLKNNIEAKSETPLTCKNDLSKKHLKQLLEAGAKFEPSGACDSADGECEISPLVSYDGEGLKQLVNGKTFKKPLVLELDKSKGMVTFNGLEYETYKKQVQFSSVLHDLMEVAKKWISKLVFTDSSNQQNTA